MLAVMCDAGYFLPFHLSYFTFDSANILIVHPVPSSLYRMLAEYASIVTLAIFLLFADVPMVGQGGIA
jgi:hypothetical protein